LRGEKDTDEWRPVVFLTLMGVQKVEGEPKRETRKIRGATGGETGSVA